MSAPEPGELLPWECPDGEPSGTGICLSGGGLRAASFSMGVLQELQARRGLLFGPNAADHLAAVSGGSYISATALLNAHVATASPGPLGEDSPEADHVVTHGRYLIEDGWFAAFPFAWRLMVSLVATGLLVLWTGFMLADVGVMMARWQPDLVVRGAGGWLAGLAAFVAVAVLAAGLYSDRLATQYLCSFVGIPTLVLTAASLVELVRHTTWLRAPSAWNVWILTLVVIVYLGASVVSFRYPGARPVSDAVVRSVQRASLMMVACLAIGAVEPCISRVFDDEPGATAAVIMIVALGGGLWASYVHDTVSLHRPYRDLAARCFAVRRGANAVERVSPPTSAKLSDLAPPDEPARRHPRLLICATANVHGARAAVPFVFRT